MADQVVLEAIRQVRATTSTRHPFHPDLLDELAQVSPRARGLAMTATLTSSHGLGNDVVVAAVPQVLSRIDAPRVDAVARGAVAQVQRIALDPVLLTAVHDVRDGRRWLNVQHRASGLRVVFSASSPNGVGIVSAHPDGIDSIDPLDQMDQLDGWDLPASGDDRWWSYRGLGIGRRIYREAARVLPDQRWGCNTASPAALGVRRALHLEDPYRWDGPCTWCTTRQIIWHTASPTDFTDHPATSVA